MPPAVQPESTMKSLVTYRTKPTIGTITPAVGQKSSFGNQMYVLACLQTTDCDARTEPALTGLSTFITILPLI